MASNPTQGEILASAYNRLLKNDLILVTIIGVGLLLTTSLTAYHDTEGHKHTHRMNHNHTDDAMAVQYGRVSTSTPSYLAGIGGWY